MSKNNLTFSMALLFFITFVFLGSIVVNEKKVDWMLPKIKEKFHAYIQQNYKKINSEIQLETVTYNQRKKQFEGKVINKENKHLYFYITYKKRKIHSTYQKDYQQMKSLIAYTEKKLNQKLKIKNTKIKISLPISNAVKKNLLEGEKIEQLKIYTLIKEDTIKNFHKETLVKYLNNLETTIKNQNLTPKDYKITLSNQEDITKEITIEKLSLPNPYLEEICQGILESDKTIENKYNIRYNYLN